MATLRFGKYQIDGPNLSELRGLKQEIFNHLVYDVDLNRVDPVIIDAGAHVGLATLFFKTKWPSSQITAIEPFSENLKYFKHNLWQNQLDTGINVIEAALDVQTGNRSLYFDSSTDQWHSTAGFISGAWDHSQTSDSVIVPTITLDSVINEPVDLLKLDIEGAETSVLHACHQLHLIRHLIVEIHPPHSADDLQNLLQKTHDVSIVSHHHGLKLLSASARIRT